MQARNGDQGLDANVLAVAVQEKQDGAILFGMLLVTAAASIGAGFVGTALKYFFFQLIENSSPIRDGGRCTPHCPIPTLRSANSFMWTPYTA